MVFNEKTLLLAYLTEDPREIVRKGTVKQIAYHVDCIAKQSNNHNQLLDLTCEVLLKRRFTRATMGSLIRYWVKDCNWHVDSWKLKNFDKMHKKLGKILVNQTAKEIELWAIKL